MSGDGTSRPDRPAIFRPPPPPRPGERAATPEAASAAMPVSSPAQGDLAPLAPETGLPGEHRGGFSRLPTAPTGVAAPSAASSPEASSLAASSSDVSSLAVSSPDAWDGSVAPAAAPAPRGFAGWALVFAIAGLAFSLFVGWAFPLGLTAIVVAILALRRPRESRAVAIWAVCLGAVSVLYSAGWLVWAATGLVGSGG